MAWQKHSRWSLKWIKFEWRPSSFPSERQLKFDLVNHRDIQQPLTALSPVNSFSFLISHPVLFTNTLINQSQQTPVFKAKRMSNFIAFYNKLRLMSRRDGKFPTINFGYSWNTRHSHLPVTYVTQCEKLELESRLHLSFIIYVITTSRMISGLVLKEWRKVSIVIVLSQVDAKHNQSRCENGADRSFTEVC